MHSVLLNYINLVLESTFQIVLVVGTQVVEEHRDELEQIPLKYN